MRDIEDHVLQLSMRGGLGNQLFQLCGAITLARKLQARLEVNETALKRHKDPSRQNWVHHLDLTNLIGDTKINWVSDKRIKLFKTRTLFNQIEEIDIVNLTKMETNLAFRGWFQDKQFVEGLKLTKNSLRPQEITTNFLPPNNSMTSNKDIGAIHMRLGDFHGTSWGVLPISWYEKIFEELNTHGDFHIHIYSDDIDGANEITQKLSPKFEFSFPERDRKLPPHELLWALRNYNTFVSSNSSLSWWASYLNITENPRIYSVWSEHLHINPWIKVS